MDTIVVYEPSCMQRRKLWPLVHATPTFLLRSGAGTLLDAIERGAGDGARISLWCRKELEWRVAQYETNEIQKKPALFLDGRCRWRSLPQFDAPAWAGYLSRNGKKEIVCVYADAEYAATFTPDSFPEALDELSAFPSRDVGEHATLFEWPWEIVAHNAQALDEDLPHGDVSLHMVRSRIEGVTLLGANVYRGRETSILPGVVLDSRRGPIWIEPGATIMGSCSIVGPVRIGAHATIGPCSFICGPVFIGSKCTVHSAAQINAGTTIGHTCKVGGEIAGSILYPFSNKPHYGGLYDSIIGSWVNMAAGSVACNRKHSYGQVAVETHQGRRSTGCETLGAIIGSHTKIGGNVKLNPGTLIGAFCDITVPVAPYLHDFIRVSSDCTQRQRIEEILNVADRRIMPRRKQTMRQEEMEIWRTLYHQEQSVAVAAD